jgi:TnpA family transposase
MRIWTHSLWDFKPHVIRNAWDETVRVIASMEERIVSPSMVLQRLGSYARQNSVYQTLSEIGRVQKTIHILKTLDNEEYRRRMGRELNKGEASHDLSRFLCFGKEGVLRGREFGDQVQTFSCLSVLHTPSSLGTCFKSRISSTSCGRRAIRSMTKL